MDAAVTEPSPMARPDERDGGRGVIGATMAMMTAIAPAA